MGAKPKILKVGEFVYTALSIFHLFTKSKTLTKSLRDLGGRYRSSISHLSKKVAPLLKAYFTTSFTCRPDTVESLCRACRVRYKHLQC